MKRALALILLLAACTPGEEADQGGLDAAARSQCIAAGGEVRRGGRLGLEFCAERSPQAGQACSRASDCSSWCDATSRTCAPYNDPFGCRSFLDEAGQPVEICVD